MDVLAQIVEIEPAVDGTIPEGFLYASIKNIGIRPTIVNGVRLNGGEAKDYPFVGKGYPDLHYAIVSESALRILYII